MAREVRVAILGDSRDFNRAVRDVQTGSSKMDRAIGGVKRMAFGLGAAFAAREIVDFGGQLISAAEESQKVTRQTEAVIKSMGNAANVSAEKVADLSSALSLKTGVDDELIQSGQNVLLTFGKIRNEVGKGNNIFDRATELTLDLSVALGKDMTSASTMVGKALNDPIAGITALTRAGVQFTDQQKEQIRAMVEAGDIAGAQKVILDELSKQFAGSAEAQATASSKLTVAWDNIKETLGEKLLPIVERFTTWLAENLPVAMAKAEEAGRKLGEFYTEHEGLVKGLAIAIGVGLAGAMAVYATNAALAAAATVAATWPIIAIIAVVALLAAGIWYAYNNWGWFRTGLQSAVKAAGYFIQGVGPIIKFLVEVAKAATAAATAIARVFNAQARFTGAGTGGAAADYMRSNPGPQVKKAQGGRVPGSLGQPVPIIAHGGEMVTTHGQQLRSGGGGGDTIVIQVGNEIVARLYADGKVSAERRGIAA